MRAATAALVVVVGVLAGPVAARATPVQIPSDTTVAPGLPVTPTTGVLVPGSTTATTVPVATNPVGGTIEEQAPDDPGDPNASRTVWMAIAGLGVVAFLILVLTIVYARYTRPGRGDPDSKEWDMPSGPDEVFAPTAARSVFEHQEDEQGFWWAED